MAPSDIEVELVIVVVNMLSLKENSKSREKEEKQARYSTVLVYLFATLFHKSYYFGSTSKPLLHLGRDQEDESILELQIFQHQTKLIDQDLVIVNRWQRHRDREIKGIIHFVVKKEDKLKMVKRR